MGLPSFGEYAGMFDRLAPAMLSTAARSAVVLAMAGAAVLMMRRASAATRYWVWLLGFAGALLLPILSAALPAWHILPNLQSRKTPATETIIFPAAASSVVPVENLNHQQPVVAAPSQKQATPVSQGAAIARPSAVRSNAPASTSALPARAANPAQWNLRWTAWMAIGWLAGTFLVLGHTLLGYLSLWSLRRRCARVSDGELYDSLIRLRRDLGVRRSVELLSSPLRTMPMTWGVFSPRLLLPPQAAVWPSEQRRTVLLHELGHVKRWDCVTQLLVQLGCAMYWFNPIAWFACHRMQIERERACDDLVLNFGSQASSYAQHLLHTVSSLPVFLLAGPAVAMARPSTLEERLRAILDTRRSRRAMSTRGILATALVMLTALVPVAMTRAQQADNQAPPGVNAIRPTPTTRPVGGPAGARGAMRFGTLPTPAPGTGPTCSFDATIYDIRIPADQIGSLDVDALQQAAGNAQAFEKALAALGPIKPLYRADQSVRLSGENVVIETETPVVTSTTIVRDGHTVSNYSYHSTGAIFSVAGNAGATGPIDLDLGIQLSAIADGGVTVGNGVKAPVMRSIKIARKGPVQPGKPFVVVSVDANSPDAEGKAVAYIGRIVVGEPQMSAKPTGGQ